MPESLATVPSRPHRRRRHRAWRDGGSSVARWDAEMLGWSVASLGIGVVGARAGASLLAPDVAPVVSQAALWAAFVAPVLWAFGRSRPRGLLTFRWVDPVIGLVWGIVLRLAQGALTSATGASAWPGGVDLWSSAFVVEAVAATTVAPLLEEFFFRAVLLICVYTVVRRMSGAAAAVMASVIVSTVLFVATHGLVAPLGVADTATLTLVGAITAICVLVTGRLWPAILVHVVYNATGIAVVVVATAV